MRIRLTFGTNEGSAALIAAAALCEALDDLEVIASVFSIESGGYIDLSDSDDPPPLQQEADSNVEFITKLRKESP